MLLSKVAADEVGGWSPEGNFIVFSVRDGAEQGLYVRNPDGVNEVQAHTVNGLRREVVTRLAVYRVPFDP